MKLSRIFALSLIAVATVSSLAIAKGGGMDSSGGDSCSMEFMEIGRKIHLDVMRKKLDIGIELNHKDFFAAIQSTKVECIEDDILVDGVLKDARNTPSHQLIEVNRFRWDAISLLARKYQLVFHEYLGILKIDDKDGKISNVYLNPKDRPAAPAIEPTPVDRAFKAEPESELAAYDDAAKGLLEAISANDRADVVAAQSTQILSRYFGFERVILKHGSKTELFVESNIALQLRSILPADFRTLSYLSVHHTISSKPNGSTGHIFDDTGVEHRLVIDDSLEETGFSVKREGFFKKSSVCELRISPQLRPGTPELKGYMSQMINCLRPWYSPNYDILRD